MAETFDLAKLTPLLECAICLRPYDNPVVLPCLHTFCYDCLDSHVSATKTPDTTFECPSCRDTCSIPAGGVADFPKNFFANSLRDTVPSYVFQHDQESAGVPGQSKTVPLCRHHQDQKTDWYCKNCHMPVCSFCFMENHNGHKWAKLSAVAKQCKDDLQDLVSQAAKYFESLQEVLENLETQRHRIEEDLKEVQENITDTEQKLIGLIKEHAAALQGKVERARMDAQEYRKEAEEEVKKSAEAVSTIRSSAQALYSESDRFPFRTVIQTPHIKQQFLQQQQISLLTIYWDLNTRDCEPGSVTTECCLGTVGLTPSVCQPTLWDLEATVGTQKDNAELAKLSGSTKLQYKGEKAIFGIASIFGTMVGVAHCDDPNIWVYTRDGELKSKVRVPDVERILGLEALDKNSGDLAVVDGKQKLLHLITLSPDLEVRCTLVKTAFLANRISRVKTGTTRAGVAIWKTSEKRCAVLDLNGTLLHQVQFDIPGTEVEISVAPTSSGYAVCDKISKTVFFVDSGGSLLRSSMYCVDPWDTVSTSWGYVLIADCLSAGKVAIFSESGDYLGNVSRKIRFPHRIQLDEAERLLDVGCGRIGEMEVRTYRFCPGDFPLPAMRLRERLLQMSVELAEVDYKM